MSLPAVAILAGGLATRLGKLAQNLPKSLLAVAGKPFIAHQLAQLKNQGIDRVVICTGHLGEQIETFVGNGSAFGLKVSYSPDGQRLLGTGGTVKKALSQLGECFFILYGDSYLDVDYSEIYDTFCSQDKLGLMTVFENASRWESSNVVYRNGFVIRYDKQMRDPEMLYIDYGLSLLSAKAFDQVASGEAVDLAEIYKQLIARGEMLGFPVAARFYQIGTPQGLKETQDYLDSLAGNPAKESA